MTIPIPATTALEEPTVCTRINELWIPVLLGALQHYLNPLQWENGIRGPYMVNPPAIWEGDAIDNENAEQQILEIMAALMAGNCEGLVTIPPGTIWMYGGETAPSGWLVCNGDTYLKSEYPELYAILGPNFDKPFGEETDFFAVPNFEGRSPIGKNSGTFDTIGEGHGALTHTLSVNEMPIHDHTTQAHRHQVFKDDFATGFGSQLPASGNAAVADNASWSEYASVDVDNAGGGAAHNNLHPVTVVSFIIKT
jgi:microcystin-dependent protein